MQRLIFIAVAACVATAMCFSAYAYCCGCVADTKNAEATIDLAKVRAEAPPYGINAVCHIEKQKRVINGRLRWWPVYVCE